VTAGRVGSAGRLLAINAVACLLLLAQYLLGMAVNVYVVLPGRHPGSGAGNYFGGATSGLAWVISDGPGWAAAHAAFGLALGVAALASVGLARRQDGRLVTGLSVLGALAIVGAGFNGASFLDYGHAFSSMIMAGLWALALACYLTGAILAAVRVTRLPLADNPVAETPAAGQARLPDRLICGRLSVTTVARPGHPAGLARRPAGRGAGPAFGPGCAARSSPPRAVRHPGSPARSGPSRRCPCRMSRADPGPGPVPWPGWRPGDRAWWAVSRPITLGQARSGRPPAPEHSVECGVLLQRNR
jgi:hypothetical protein